MAKKKKNVGKIYKTTDGIFNGRDDIKKPRPVAVVDQRKDDGAVALVKLHTRKGKDGKMYIDELVLRPEDHPSLTEETIVEKRVYIGRKTETGHEPIFQGDLIDQSDKLTREELRKVKKGVKGGTKDQRGKYKQKMKKWHKHFKK